MLTTSEAKSRKSYKNSQLITKNINVNQFSFKQITPLELFFLQLLYHHIGPSRLEKKVGAVKHLASRKPLAGQKSQPVSSQARSPWRMLAAFIADHAELMGPDMGWLLTTSQLTLLPSLTPTILQKRSWVRVPGFEPISLTCERSQMP